MICTAIYAYFNYQTTREEQLTIREENQHRHELRLAEDKHRRDMS